MFIADEDMDVLTEANVWGTPSWAIEGRAEFVVSGDSHLLDVGEQGSIVVVTPRAFLDVLEGRA